MTLKIKLTYGGTGAQIYWCAYGVW